MSTQHYLGLWHLVPELCLYQHGEPPVAGLYEIRALDGLLTISVQWTDSAGEVRQLTFGGPPDGSAEPLQAPGVTHLTLTHIDDKTLDSAAYNGAERVAYARRVAHGDLLATVQITYMPSGAVSNFQVYRRVAG